QSLSKELDAYENRWGSALDDLRKDNLDRFLEKSPRWKERLDDKKIGSLDAVRRRRTLLELLAALKEFTAGRTDVWTRLHDMRRIDEEAKEAKYRTDVRLAALLRMRALLLRIAGTELLIPEEAEAEEEPSSDQAAGG